MHNPAMYIIAIGWLYVTLLIAVNERSVFLGIISFVFYGLLPCALRRFARKTGRFFDLAQIADIKSSTSAGELLRCTSIAQR